MSAPSPLRAIANCRSRGTSYSERVAGGHGEPSNSLRRAALRRALDERCAATSQSIMVFLLSSSSENCCSANISRARFRRIGCHVRIEVGTCVAVPFEYA
jgi:hypothetical protein